jgi:tripartite-type tricarboxylate transporter receptor subunit TctC
MPASSCSQTRTLLAIWESSVSARTLAPSRTPPEAVNWLQRETLKILSTPEMKEKLYKTGFQVRPKGAKDAWARVTKEIEMFKAIIEQASIKKL